MILVLGNIYIPLTTGLLSFPVASSFGLLLGVFKAAVPNLGVVTPGTAFEKSFPIKGAGEPAEPIAITPTSSAIRTVDCRKVGKGFLLTWFVQASGTGTGTRTTQNCGCHHLQVLHQVPALS